MIQGCRLDTPNFEQELSDQYEVTLDLLMRLTRDLLDGDLSRVGFPGFSFPLGQTKTTQDNFSKC